MIMNSLPNDRIPKPKNSGYVAVKTLFLMISV
jgi:hypothetical protein